MTSDDLLASQDGSVEGQGGVEDDLERLRILLLGKEQEQIRRILERLDNPGRYAREIGDVLPPAIDHAASRGPELERSLAPALERVTRRAIQSDTKSFADALFPVMGPAIRRSIAEALKSMLQSLNQALEYSLSIRGLRWRLEAIRTGRSFAEVVLSKTLVYRVEQVFLIHRENSLLLQHVVAPDVEAQDADMVSGMLSAIQDFVRDSFRVGQEETLQTMEVGELQVWVEQGPHAVIAAVVRGSAPVEFRQVLREKLELFHRDLGLEMEAFSGDASPFERTRSHLEDCLRSQKVKQERGFAPVTWVMICALVLVLGWWVVDRWQSHRQVARLLEILRAEPGLVVTGVERHRGVTEVFGLRDPLARDEESLLQAARIDGNDIQLRTAPFHSLDDELVLARARSALDPPAGAELSFSDGTLKAVGAVRDRWRQQARGVAALLPGVLGYDDSGLEVLDDQAASMKELEGLRHSVEAHVVQFELGSAEISPQESEKLAPVVDEIVEIIRLAESAFAFVAVRIEGWADPTGRPEFNAQLSKDRAEVVVRFFVDRGIPERLVQPIGRGTLLPLKERQSGEEDGYDALRRVTFVVELTTLTVEKGGR